MVYSINFEPQGHRGPRDDQTPWGVANCQFAIEDQLTLWVISYWLIVNSGMWST